MSWKHNLKKGPLLKSILLRSQIRFLKEAFHPDLGFRVKVAHHSSIVKLAAAFKAGRSSQWLSA
jgi:hypothetical protein